MMNMLLIIHYCVFKRFQVNPQKPLLPLPHIQTCNVTEHTLWSILGRESPLNGLSGKACRIIRSDIRHPARKTRSGPTLNPTYQFLAGLALAHFVLGVELVAVLLEVLLDVLDLVLGQQGGRPGTPGQLEKMAVLFKKTVLFSTKLRK